ncbi:MAG: VCBS repeat-containing protein, partial [Planctomycetota bacterium]
MNPSSPLQLNLPREALTMKLYFPAALILPFAGFASAQWQHSDLPPLAGFSAAPGHGVLAADFNLDGRMDLAIPNYFTGNIVWLEAGAGGTWQSHTVGTPASSLSGCELIDVNGDGLSDLVATWLAPGGGQMVWLENPGNGGSWPSHAVSAPFTVEESTQLTVLDLDGDGRDDLMHSVLDSLGYRNHLVYRNTGIGLVIVNNLGIGADPTLPIPGDYDGDGDLDVAFPFTGSNVTYWVQNQSTPGTIAFAGYTALPSFSLGIALDADQDGDDDLLCHIPSGPQWDGLAWSQNSAGIFAVPQSNATLPNVG